MLGCQVGNMAKSTQSKKSSDLVVGTERVDSDTEFLILASKGIWEVHTNNNLFHYCSKLKSFKKTNNKQTKTWILLLSYNLSRPFPWFPHGACCRVHKIEGWDGLNVSNCSTFKNTFQVNFKKIFTCLTVYQAMKPQEAVNLISHLDDPHEGAECLAREAITRNSKSNISCLVIRFD